MHSEYVLKMKEQKQLFEESVLNYDPYQDGFKILNTDYENYMIVYHCFEHDDDEENDEDES